MHRLSKRLDTLTESATVRLNAESQRLRAAGIRVLNLTVGELDIDTPPYIARGVAQHLSRNKYTPVSGMPELRSAIADDASKKYKRRITAAEVAVTAGAKQALYNIFQVLCNPGDEIIIPTPCWVSYEHLVMLAGARPVFVPCKKDFSLDVPALRRALTKRTKAIIINSPNNPTGAIYSAQSLRALAGVCAGKNIFLVSDDIYDTLTYGAAYVSPARFFKDHSKVVIINGYSKSHALTGWRIGYMVAPCDIIEANNRLQSHTSGNASVISQLAAIESYKRAITPGIVKRLARKKRIAETLLSRIPGISFKVSQGAFYFFVDVRKSTTDTVHFCERLLKDEHVAVVPGEAFRAPGYFRMSFAVPDQELRDALTRMRTHIKQVYQSPHLHA